MKKFFISAIIIATIINSAFADDPAMKNSVVKIFTILKSADYKQPWQMGYQKNAGGSGFIISGNRIMTSAHVVADSTFIQVCKYGEADRYTAQIEQIDNDCDLAVLTVSDGSFFKNAKPLEIGGLPEQGDKVTVYGFPIGGDELSVTQGIVSRIEIGEYSHSRENFLTVQIDAAINPGNSGGPVFLDGKVAGVAFELYQYAEKIGYIIPAPIVNHFLNDKKGDRYRGFGYMGISIQKLENEDQRKFLGMKKGQTGVEINKVAYGASAWGVLKENDVLLELDGVQIANDGTVPFGGKKERIALRYLLMSKYAGDNIKAKILRDKKIMDVEMTLKREEDIIPLKQYDVKPDYYIYGGAVFARLTGNYLETPDLGMDSLQLTYHYMNDVKSQEKQEVVIMQYVLADEINIGYNEWKNMVVDKVDGQTVAGLRDMIEKIEGAKGEYVQIEMESGEKMVFNVSKTKEANKRILDRYKIPSDRSDDLADKKQENNE